MLQFVSNQFGIVSGGHRSEDDNASFVEAYSRKSIEVNEAGWFDFLQKYRWYDLTKCWNSRVPEGGPWSVDNPKVWDNLRGSIELANRLLRALIIDRHNG